MGRPKEMYGKITILNPILPNELLDIFKKLDNITEQKLNYPLMPSQWRAQFGINGKRKGQIWILPSLLLSASCADIPFVWLGVLHLLDLAVAQAGETGVLDTGDRMIPMEQWNGQYGYAVTAVGNGSSYRRKWGLAACPV
jgi:hypothetical protein